MTFFIVIALAITGTAWIAVTHPLWLLLAGLLWLLAAAFFGIRRS